MKRRHHLDDAQRSQQRSGPLQVRCDSTVVRPLLRAITERTGETSGGLITRLVVAEALRIGVACAPRAGAA